MKCYGIHWINRITIPNLICARIPGTGGNCNGGLACAEHHTVKCGTNGRYCPDHAHSHNFSTEWKADHWKVCSCGDKVLVSAHDYGKGYTCTKCGYVDEARRAVLDAEAMQIAATSMAGTATVTCYENGRAIASCSSGKDKTIVKIRLGEDYAGRSFTVKLGGKIICEGEFGSDGTYVLEDVTIGALYRLYIG